ncbi:MAG: hypothetical protein Q4D23_12030 [Bacteroidales bacterium]|nr:hypothetical protein [Bacteroidales bacterium]
MTKTLRLMNPLLLALSMLFALGAEARNTDSLRWAPEWGAELITEQQVTTKGRYRSATEGDAFIRKNCANLLRLQANLPIAHGFSVDVGSLSTFMTAKESIGDDLQTFSNLDAERIPFALSQCGVNWNAGDHHSLFLGIRNMNEDYFCSPVTSLFTNSSCGIFPTISANYDIANYPVASVGVHYRYGPTPSPSPKGRGEVTSPINGSSEDVVSTPLHSREGSGVCLQVSLYNGRGYNRFTGRENVFRFCPKDDGLFGLAEVQYHRGGSSYFLGSSIYLSPSTRTHEYSATKPLSSIESPPSGDTWGSLSFTPWAYTEQRINDRLSIIAGYSHAFDTSPQSGGLRGAACRDFAGLGGRYAWDRAELGVFTDYANFAEGSEWATEFTCMVTLTPHFFLQPSVHAIFMPEATTTFQGAATLRLGVAF